MSELRMPSMGSDMTAGTLVAWRRAVGDRVARGDVYAEVETDKGVLEIEAFEAGVIDAQLVAVGTKVPVGTPLVRLRDGATTSAETKASPASAPAASAPPVSATPAPAPAAPAPGIAWLQRFPPSVRHLARELGVDPLAVLTARFAHAPAPSPTPGARARVTPRARQLAAKLGVDVEHLTGTGPEGAITADDVERAAASAHAPSPAPSPADAALRMRRAIAATMERSNREIPHYWVETTIDLARATAWLEGANASRDVEHRLVIGALLLKACALALRRVPELNGSWVDGALRPADHVHLGVAVSLRGGGLVAPAIHDADTLDLAALMQALGDLVARARSGKLRASELADPTCTVTSLGERGVERVVPRIFPPQVAMLGLGRVVSRPCAVGERVEVRPTVSATLAGDHRATDGHRGAAFLAALDDLMQRPEAL